MKIAVIGGTLSLALASILVSHATMATELSVAVPDLGESAYAVGVKDTQLTDMVDFDVELLSGKDIDQVVNLGLDLTLPTIAVSDKEGAATLSPYASVYHSIVENGESNSTYEVGATLGVMPDLNLDASVISDFDDADQTKLQASVDYQINPKLNTELEYVYDTDLSDLASAKVTATYDFTPAVYTEVGYEFEADTAGVTLGYKF